MTSSAASLSGGIGVAAESFPATLAASAPAPRPARTCRRCTMALSSTRVADPEPNVPADLRVRKSELCTARIEFRRSALRLDPVAHGAEARERRRPLIARRAADDGEHVGTEAPQLQP